MILWDSLPKDVKNAQVKGEPGQVFEREDLQKIIKHAKHMRLRKSAQLKIVRGCMWGNIVNVCPFLIFHWTWVYGHCWRLELV